MNEWLNLSTSQKIIDIVLLIIFLAFMLGLVAFFIKFTKAKKISKSGIEFSSTEEKNKNNSNNINFLNHRFFKLMILIQTKGYILENCSNLNMDKHIINVEFLQKCYFKTIYEEMKNFFIEIKNANGEKIYTLPEIIRDIPTKIYDKSSLLRITLNDGSIINGVPEIYTIKFDKWNRKYILSLVENISDIIADSFHKDWQSKCVAFLDSLYLCSIITINDAERTLEYLNGNLDKEIEEKKRVWMDQL